MNHQKAELKNDNRQYIMERPLRGPWFTFSSEDKSLETLEKMLKTTTQSNIRPGEYSTKTTFRTTFATIIVKCPLESVFSKELLQKVNLLVNLKKKTSFSVKK